MALIKCEDCGHAVSRRAGICPGCGAFRKHTDPPHWLLGQGVGAILIVGGMFACTSGGLSLLTKVLFVAGVVIALGARLGAWVDRQQ